MVWTRLLSLLLGATVYSFSIILAVFLLGLGIGSGCRLICWRACPGIRDIALGLCQMLLAGAIAWAASSFPNRFPTGRSIPECTQMIGGRGIFFSWIFSGPPGWFCRPPCSGAPVSRLRLRQLPSRTGIRDAWWEAFIAANTVGAILGSLAFSLLVIPQFGTQWAERIADHCGGGLRQLSHCASCLFAGIPDSRNG